MLDGQRCCTSPGCGLGNVSRGPSSGAATLPETANAAAGGGGVCGSLDNALTLVSSVRRFLPCDKNQCTDALLVLLVPGRVVFAWDGRSFTNVMHGVSESHALPERERGIISDPFSSRIPFPDVLSFVLEQQYGSRAPDYWRDILLIRCGDVHLNPGPVRDFRRMGSVCDSKCPLMSFRGY